MRSGVDFSSEQQTTNRFDSLAAIISEESDDVALILLRPIWIGHVNIEGSRASRDSFGSGSFLFRSPDFLCDFAVGRP
jgi:hypothetical protein